MALTLPTLSFRREQSVVLEPDKATGVCPQFGACKRIRDIMDYTHGRDVPSLQGAQMATLEAEKMDCYAFGVCRYENGCTYAPVEA